MATGEKSEILHDTRQSAVSAADEDVSHRVRDTGEVFDIVAEHHSRVGIVVEKESVSGSGSDVGHCNIHLRSAVTLSVAVVLLVEHHESVALEVHSHASFAGTV